MQQLKTLLLQEQIYLAIRQFFADKHFHEVFPTVLQASIPLEPTLYPFSTDWQSQNKTKRAYLSTSPEKNLKTALATGLNPCFALGKSFRNLEQSGSQHQPEFTMLEWYRTESSSTAIMADARALFLFVKQHINVWQQKNTNELLTYQNDSIDLSQWETVSITTVFLQRFGIELSELISDSAMEKFAQKLGYDTAQASWEQLFNQCFLNEIEPTITKQPTFLIDFPARISPLCMPQPDRPYLADRFEIYVAGMELGNGNKEGTNAAAIRKSFQTEASDRLQAKLSVQPIDEQFLADVAKLDGLNCAGVGVGVERLMMLFANSTDIEMVAPFSFITNR